MIALRQHLEQFHPISDEDWALFEKKFKFKSFQAGEYLLHKDEICSFLGFVVSGAFKAVWVNNSQKQRSLYFFLPRNAISAYSSFLTQTPSTAQIQCISAGSIVYFSYEDTTELMYQLPSYRIIHRLCTEQIAIQLINRLKELTALSTEERYKKLLAEQPDILQILPLNYIAEYINCEPQSLSRIRKKLSKNTN